MGDIEHTKRQEPYWVWACKTCGKQLKNAMSQHCGDFGQTIYLVPDDLHRGAVGALEKIDALIEADMPTGPFRVRIEEIVADALAIARGRYPAGDNPSEDKAVRP